MKQAGKMFGYVAGWGALALALRCGASGTAGSPTNDAGTDDASASGSSGTGVSSGGGSSSGGSSSGSSGGVANPGDGDAGTGVGSADTYFLTPIRLGCVGAGCPLCLPQVLPRDASGQTLCRMFLELTAGDSCAAHGLTPASADNLASFDSQAGQPPPGALCLLPQLPAANQTSGSCSMSSAAGWCYLTGAAAGHCAQTIAVSPTAVPQGAVALLGCGQTAASSSPSATSAASVGIACIPSEERSSAFSGFNLLQVTLDEGNSACGSDVCLVNHFQGLTSCPYGQDSTGAAPPGAQPCALPDGGAAVHPEGGAGQYVAPWCPDRQPSSAVYCSCRCENALGKTDDGASYCSCPMGYTCSQVVPAVEPGDPRSGGYCVRTGTQYSSSTACSSECYPVTMPCP